jgi:exosortase E/protease (VPEID-CTERM system)
MHHPEASPGHSLRNRLLALASLLVAELFILSQLRHAWLPLVQPAAAPIVFAASLAFFGRHRLRSATLAADPISSRFAALHALCFSLMAAISLYMLRALSASTWPVKALLTLWFASLILLVPSLLCTFFAPRRLIPAFRSLGSAWAYATLSAILAMTARSLIRLAWDAPNSRFGQTLTAATFRGVQALLTLFYTDVVADPVHSILGTRNFQVLVAGTCSGMEGLALVLVLTVGWIVYARHELRIARAVCLIPIALLLIALLNVARIAALIAIGDAGHPKVAINGFHAEAGWILFNLVAFGFLLTAQHLAWVRKPQPEIAEAPAKVVISAPSATNYAAVYLLPFLAILATSFITQATSSGFEWLYPLRVAAAAVALWAFRSHYRRMDWRCGWLGPTAGLLVFAIWLALRRASPGNGALLASSLAALPAWQRIAWLAMRILAATITVPIAEELAFRGYLARRLMQADIEAVSFRDLSLPSILISSIAFGLMHGRMAIAGFTAGLAFAFLAKLRGRLGESIAAHATANLLLGLWVLLRGDYSLW